MILKLYPGTYVNMHFAILYVIKHINILLIGKMFGDNWSTQVWEYSIYMYFRAPNTCIELSAEICIEFYKVCIKFQNLGYIYALL